MLRLLAIVSVFLAVHSAPNTISESDNVKQARKVIAAENYPAETHHVITKDGYILELHRIPHGKKPEPPGHKARPVVFLMHGLLGASNSFTYLGPERGIAYNLADAGYDVWMGNARGNRFSRRHVTLDADKNKRSFFDFSFEEIALDDLPSMFDYVLSQTRQEKFHYIGHSQGGTVFLVLNSMTSEYHEKIISAHLLAGVGYQNNFPNQDLKRLASTTDIIYNTMRLAGNVELFPPGSDGMFGKSGSNAKILDGIFDVDVSSELLAGASLKQIAHFGQNIRDKAFRRWNFGAIQNLGIYRKISPPAYDLSKIDIDVTLHYSLSDTLLSEEDTIAMAKDMPNAKARKVARDSFTHLDYISGDDAKELINNFIIESLKKP